MNDKNNLKFNLSLESIADFVAEMGGEPSIKGDFFTAKTICHCGESHKLYYYNNTHLFKCYSGCPEESFDIFQLVMKVKKVELYQAINITANYFGYQIEQETNEWEHSLSDQEYFESKKSSDTVTNVSETLATFDDKIIAYYPQPHIANWEAEGISYDTIKRNHIHYDPCNQGIIVPHYNISGGLVGIRERTLIKEEEQYGKYRPAVFDGKMYNHPLGFNLYNLNNSKDNIQQIGKAIVFEGEKSPLIYQSTFDTDISVACCGSNLIKYQIQLLRRSGAKEVIVAFDRQYKEVGDEEYIQWTHKLKVIWDKYNSLCQISFILDKEHLLGYKDSPIDKGKEIFLELFKKRIFL